MMGIMEESTIPGWEGGKHMSGNYWLYFFSFNILANDALKQNTKATKRLLKFKLLKTCITLFFSNCIIHAFYVLYCV